MIFMLFGGSSIKLSNRYQHSLDYLVDYLVCSSLITCRKKTRGKSTFIAASEGNYSKIFSHLESFQEQNGRFREF
jgi:hypothetical protein